MFGHPYNDFKKLIPTKLFVRIVFKISGTSTNLFEVDRNKQLINDLSGQIIFIDNLPRLTQIDEIHHSNRRVITGALSKNILFINECIIVKKDFVEVFELLLSFYEFLNFGVLVVSHEAFSIMFFHIHFP